MNVSELIEKLKEFDGDLDVMTWDNDFGYFYDIEDVSIREKNGSTFVELE